MKKIERVVHLMGFCKRVGEGAETTPSFGHPSNVRSGETTPSFGHPSYVRRGKGGTALGTCKAKPPKNC